MMDAYTHLDINAPDPITEFTARMASAKIDRALVIETWSGNNHLCVEGLIGWRRPDFRVVPCFRPEHNLPALDMIDHPMVAGLRVRSTDLDRLGKWADRIQSSAKWLVPHAERGIGPLTRELMRLLRTYRNLRLYLPHCGWPRRNRTDDQEWANSISELATVPNIVVGISAIESFSTGPFPHLDVHPFVEKLVEEFGVNSLVAASDYPTFEQTRYVDYIQLAEYWIKSHDIDWSPRFESLVFGVSS